MRKDLLKVRFYCRKCGKVYDENVAIRRKDAISAEFEAYCYHCFKLNELDFLKSRKYK